MDDDDDDYADSNNGDGDREGEYGELRILWGEEGDIFDSVMQIWQFLIGLKLNMSNIDNRPKDDEDTFPLFLHENQWQDQC